MLEPRTINAETWWYVEPGHVQLYTARETGGVRVTVLKAAHLRRMLNDIAKVKIPRRKK